jgi:hypothetical protein
MRLATDALMRYRQNLQQYITYLASRAIAKNAGAKCWQCNRQRHGDWSGAFWPLVEDWLETRCAPKRLVYTAKMRN